MKKHAFASLLGLSFAAFASFACSDQVDPEQPVASDTPPVTSAEPEPAAPTPGTTEPAPAPAAPA